MSRLLKNPLLSYIGIKTRAVTRSTTQRGSYANLGTLLVLLDNYVANSGNYQSYQGINFSDYLTKVRKLPGCAKIQNHAINNRLNDEFRRYFRAANTEPVERVPVPGNAGATTYKLTLSLLETGESELDMPRFASALSGIVGMYFHYREIGSKEIVELCMKLADNPLANEEAIIEYLKQCIRDDDARIFEVAAFVVLKAKYVGKKVFIGENREALHEVPLELYRTGRVNANDGGIDYVLTPLGEYFQATQDFNFEKYFLDVDKLRKFPIRFIIQTELTAGEAYEQIRKHAAKEYSDQDVLKSYLGCFKEVLTLVDLERILDELKKLPKEHKAAALAGMLSDFAVNYSVEYNLDFASKAK